MRNDDIAAAQPHGARRRCGSARTGRGVVCRA